MKYNGSVSAVGKIDLFQQTVGLIIGVAWHRPYKPSAFGRLEVEKTTFFSFRVQVGAENVVAASLKRLSRGGVVVLAASAVFLHCGLSLWF